MTLLLLLSVIPFVYSQNEFVNMTNTTYNNSSTNESILIMYNSTDSFNESWQNETNEYNSSYYDEQNENSVNETFVNDINMSSSELDLNNQTNNLTNSTLDNITIEGLLDEVNYTDFNIVNISPTLVAVGDNLFTIEIENTGSTTIENLIPLVSGYGFSSYKTIPIKELLPSERDLAYVFAQLNYESEVILTVTINDKTEYFTINVLSESQAVNESIIIDENEQLNITNRLYLLEDDYKTMQESIKKMEKDYFVNDIDLKDLKDYISRSKLQLLSGNLEQANISLVLAEEEFLDLNNKLVSAKKKSIFDTIKDNILLISTLAGAMITLYTFYEFVKRKQKGLYKKIKEFKVDPNTKIEVLKRFKKDSKEEKQDTNNNKE